MPFVLTPEHFDRARAKLDAAEEQIKADRDKLAVLERDVAALVARCEPAALEVRSPAKSIKPRKPKGSRQVKAPELNRRYSPEQNEALRTASRGDLPQLAKEWGRTADGLEKKREALLEPTRRDTVAKPVAETTQREPAPPHENDPVVEDRNMEWDPPPPHRLERPGIPVDGLVDNGPGNKRIYDERAFASKEPSR